MPPDPLFAAPVVENLVHTPMSDDDHRIDDDQNPGEVDACDQLMRQLRQAIHQPAQREEEALSVRPACAGLNRKGRWSSALRPARKSCWPALCLNETRAFNYLSMNRLVAPYPETRCAR